MYLSNLNFFYKSGIFIGGINNLDTKLNLFNLGFFLGKKQIFFVVNYQQFLYNIRIFLFFLYRLSSLRGKVLAFDDRLYIRRCLIFFLKRANQSYIVKHWIGGTLTNFKNFKLFFFQITKGLVSEKKYYDLFIYHYGLKNLQQMPSLVIFSNPNNENVADQEIFRLAVPLVSLIDMNTKNNFGVTFPIPSNVNSTKALIFFYSIIGDSLMYGFLRPVSYFFNMFFKRLKKMRKFVFLKQKIYQRLYNNVFYFSQKNFKLTNFFFKSKYKYNLKFLIVYSKMRKTFLKKYFKNSFFVLWSLKRILKIKKKRRKLYKKLFRYKKRQKRYKFFKVFKILRKKFRRSLKRNYRYFLKKYFKTYASLSFIILYKWYKEYYKKQELYEVLKTAKYEEEHVELILDEFDELPQERKVKELKKLNKKFEKLQNVFFKRNNKLINLKDNQDVFVQKYNNLKFFNEKRKLFFSFKNFNIIKKKKNYFCYNDLRKFIDKNSYIVIKNKNVLNYKDLNLFFYRKNKFLKLLKKRKFIHIYKFFNTKEDNKFIFEILYSKFNND